METVLNRIHNVDCVDGLKGIRSETVHLAFADPPFNIGYSYDVYDDRLERDHYLDWCGQWMSELHRILIPTGTFWLAIGDEYAAELKVKAQEVGFKLRSWVIWYYTFGVHCKNKFTRSHAHLFYFVKNESKFCFHPKEIAVPSARQLIYADKRANPSGRTPDDTWILRPQDSRDAFRSQEDIWYFPRVNGTFKERAGFHGCQMPEQLLGRIIRSCSSSGETVVDPFSGSATTLVVAKKLDRQFLGFELSEEYSRLGAERLSRTLVGDKLEGAEDPKTTVRSRDEVEESRKSKKKQSARRPELAEGFLPNFLTMTTDESTDSLVVNAFHATSHGNSVDRVVIDPILNRAFQQQCDSMKVSGSQESRNRLLFSLRASGEILPSSSPETSPTFLWEQFDPILYACEIAWRRIGNLYPDLSLDEIFCIPDLAEQFDELCRLLAPPGFTSYELRFGALRLRSEVTKEIDRLERQDDFEPFSFPLDDISECKLSDFDLSSIPSRPGIYQISDAADQTYYLGATLRLDRRFNNQFSSLPRETLERWMGPAQTIRLRWKEWKITPERPLQAALQLLRHSPTSLNVGSFDEIILSPE